MELDGYLGALGQLPSYDQLRMNALAIRGQQLQNQEAQQQIEARTQQQADEAAFQAAVADIGANPTADRLRALAVRFPRFAPGINQAAQGMEKQQQTRVIGDLAQAHAALGATGAGQTRGIEIAKSIFQRHVDADTAAGRPVDQTDKAVLDMLNSGDPAQIKAARGFVFSTLNALDPAAGKNLLESGEGSVRKGQVVGRAIGHYDDAGNWVTDYRDPESPQYRELEVVGPDGVTRKSIVAVGGEGGGLVSGTGGGAGGSGAPSGRTVGGWTPRARNGGDNSDAAVDGKISGMAGALGIDATTPFPASMSNLDIARALTLSEGGAGSLADRNNNPGNLRDPKTGAYRVFPSKEAGLRAAAAQVARNRARGQNTIQTMVEGLPAGRRGNGVGPRVVAMGAPVQRPAPAGYQYRADGMTLEPIPGGPADKQPGAGKPLSEGTIKRIEPKIEARDQLASALGSFRDEYGGHTVLGDVSNTIQSVSGIGPAGQRDWWAQFRSVDNIIRNQLFGASLTANEKSAYDATSITPRMTAPEIRRNLQSRIQIVNRALARQRNVLTKGGFSQEAVSALFDPLGGQSPAQPRGFRVLRVRPK